LIVIPAKAGIQKNNWIPHQVRNDGMRSHPHTGFDIAKCDVKAEQKTKFTLSLPSPLPAFDGAS
jgi:hypothetical protein